LRDQENGHARALWVRVNRPSKRSPAIDGPATEVIVFIRI
jgi:hypothetical protein